MSQRSMVVSIIGRPNVGKSTIFNRLMKKQHLAMTHDQPGVTRDRHYGIMNLEEHIEGTTYAEEIILVDTGGFYPEKIEIDTHKKKNNVDPFFNIMADHAKLAIQESDLVLFVVDVREGFLPFDKGICDYIKSTRKPFLLILNKFDTEKQEGDQYDFYTLGLDEEDMLRVSAEHNRGFYDLREKMLLMATKFKTTEQTELEEHLQKGVKPRNDVVSSVAIIGAPNAGKSTLLNCMVGAQRALVSEIAGTTVDPIEGYIDLYFGPDIDMLSPIDDKFRKDTMEIFEELKRFQESGDVDLNISVDEDDLTEEEKKIYVEYGQTAEATFDDADSDVGASSDFSFDESNTGPDLYSEKEIMNAIEKNWDDKAPEEEVANLEFAKHVNRWRSIKIVDTAGIRKAKLVDGFIETQSVYRSLRSISESEIVLFMVDSTLGITHQDRRLCDIALEKGKSIIICLNKIDLLREIFADQKKKKEWMQNLRDEVPWLNFCQLVTISAQKNRNINYLREAIKRTIVIRNRKIPTGALNRCLLQLTDKNPVIVKRTNGTRFKVKYASMLKSSPPTFLLFSNKSQGIPENYRRYLVNGLRKEFDLTNTPVHLIFRTSTDIERRMRKVEKKGPSKSK
jgi:GTP-binding protein